jgi:hypothetical protein
VFFVNDSYNKRRRVYFFHLYLLRPLETQNNISLGFIEFKMFFAYFGL